MGKQLIRLAEFDNPGGGHVWTMNIKEKHCPLGLFESDLSHYLHLLPYDAFEGDITSIAEFLKMGPFPKLNAAIGSGVYSTMLNIQHIDHVNMLAGQAYRFDRETYRLYMLVVVEYYDNVPGTIQNNSSAD